VDAVPAAANLTGLMIEMRDDQSAAAAQLPRQIGITKPSAS